MPDDKEDRMAERHGELITLGEAQERFGVSRFKLTQLVRDGVLPVFQSELDRREKLVRVADLERLAQPRAIDAEDGRGKPAPVAA